MEDKKFTEEGWVLIPGYEELYAFRVNDDIKGGEILCFEKYIEVIKRGTRFFTEKIKKPAVDTHGYLFTCLHNNGKIKRFGYHQLSALLFIPNPEQKPHINHKFGLKQDKRPSQLEWVTPKENIHHAIRTGLLKLKGKDNIQSKAIIQKTMLGVFIKEWGSIGEASRELNVHPTTISRACTKKYIQCKGFIWDFK